MSSDRRLYLPAGYTLAILQEAAAQRYETGAAAGRAHEPTDPASAVVLDEDEAHYGRRVLRLADGAEVLVLDGEGRSQDARVRHEGRQGLSVMLLGRPQVTRPRPGHITLLCAVPKGERADWLVEKVSELGVSALRFAAFARSNPGANKQGRGARWLRLARAAGRQAQHGHVPAIGEPQPLADLAEQEASLGGQRVTLSPSDASPSLHAVLAPGLSPAAAPFAGPPAYTLVIGPEGGLTPDELQALDALGYHRASLGPFVLRLETAAVVAAAACLWAADRRAGTGPQQQASEAGQSP